MPRTLSEETADTLTPETEATTEATEETLLESTKKTVPEVIGETVPEVTEEPLPEVIEETEAAPEPIEESPLPVEEPLPEESAGEDEEELLLEEVSDRLWYTAPAGAEMTVEPVLQKLSAFSGAESAKNGVRSVKFTGLEPGEEYVLIVSLIPGSLVPENLLYIDQDNANPDGTLSFTYIPRQDVSARVQLYGVPAGRTVTLDREYLTMEVGSADQKLTAAVTPEEWAGNLTWSAENPENTEVISVNEFGDVTPMAPGTAYAVATVTHGQYVFSARCRVDVTQKQANQEVTGVQLGTTSLTTELLRTDYAAFDVILLLAQNRNPEVTPDTIAPDGGMEDNGVAIESAAFADEKAAAVFDLAVKDDRTLLVVPKASAINNPKPVAGSYTSKVRVTVDGKAFITDTALKLTVKKSILILKHIDLSVGYVAGFSGAVAAILMTQFGVNEWIAILAVLVLGLCIGLYQGTLVTRVGVPAFVTTLAGMFIFRGLLSRALQETGTIIVPNKGFNALSNGFIPDIPGVDLGFHLLTVLIGVILDAVLIFTQVKARQNKLKYSLASRRQI